jgi:ribosome-binding ATPase YchF (GTP1/OBG family)
MIIGLIGKPSSGKSSFFKAATMIDVKISSVPFTTIAPNIGIGYVTVDCVCKKFNIKCNPKHGYCKNGKRFIPVKLVDCGGLIPDSHLGKGIGNKFLDDIRQASVLTQIVDCSGLTDSEGNPTTGYNPEDEMKFLETEIDLWFAGIISRALDKFGEKLKTMSKFDLIDSIAQQISGLDVDKKYIEEVLEKIPITDTENFARELRKISKPIIFATNKIDLKEAQENFENLAKKYQNIVPTSADSEIALKKAAEKGMIEYMPEDGFEITSAEKLEGPQLKALEIIKRNVVEKYGSTGVQTCLNKAVFEFLNYIAVYPVADVNKLADKDGNILPDVFLVPNGTTMKEFAFKVHTTMGEKFICGTDAKTKMKLSADHKLKNNDIVSISFSR